MSKVQRGNGSSDQANHDKDIGLRSITPTTHLQRDLYRDAPDMQLGGLAPGGIDDTIFYQDIYQHKTWKSNIVSFGINSYHVPIRVKLEEHNALQAKNIAKLGAMSNASNHTQYTQFVPQIIPTQFEQDLVGCAVRYLIDQDKKVVLVDTFPRALKPDTTKKLKLGDIEIPAQSEPLPTHVVVLYKNAKGDILVIDPSNPKFSGHLQHIAGAMGKNILVSTSPAETHKIYTPKAKTGPNKDLYRDCVDLSVKLAALLDLDTNDYPTHDDVMRSKAVFLVSNNIAITKVYIDQPLRIKQVSHLIKIEEINDKLLQCKHSLDQEMQSAEADFKREQAVLKQQYDAKVEQVSIKYDREISSLIGDVASDTELEGNYA